MKDVTIYSSASCDWTSREGRFFAALEYQGRYKYLTGAQSDTTADRCILTGLLEAVHLIREPCKLTLVTATRFGFSRVRKPKGSNRELKQLLLNMIEDKRCVFEFDVWTGDGDRLKLKLSEIEKVAIKIDSVDVISLHAIEKSRPEGLF